MLLYLNKYVHSYSENRPRETPTIMNTVPAAAAALVMLRTFSYGDDGAARGPYDERGDDGGDRTCTPNLGYILGAR